VTTQTRPSPGLQLEQEPAHVPADGEDPGAFEEQVKRGLYKGPKMPGLGASLRSARRLWAVGRLRGPQARRLHHQPPIVATATAWPKGASVSRMFAELLGKEAGLLCRGKGRPPCTSRIRRPATWAPTPIVGPAPARPRQRRGRCRPRCGKSGPGSRLCFFGGRARLGAGAALRGHEHGRASGSCPSSYVCENNLYGEYTPPAPRRSAGEILPAAARGGRPRRGAWDGQGRPGRYTPPMKAAGGKRQRGPRGGGPRFPRMQDLPLLRATTWGRRHRDYRTKGRGAGLDEPTATRS